MMEVRCADVSRRHITTHPDGISLLLSAGSRRSVPLTPPPPTRPYFLLTRPNYYCVAFHVGSMITLTGVSRSHMLLPGPVVEDRRRQRRGRGGCGADDGQEPNARIEPRLHPAHLAGGEGRPGGRRRRRGGGGRGSHRGGRQGYGPHRILWRRPRHGRPQRDGRGGDLWNLNNHFRTPGGHLNLQPSESIEGHRIVCPLMQLFIFRNFAHLPPDRCSLIFHM